jgi:hypothetical protein
MKFLIIFVAGISLGKAMSTTSREEIKIPIIVDDVKNTFHPYFDTKPVECQTWKIKLNPLNKLDEKWLKDHGGQSLILTEDNMVIKIGKNMYKPNQEYDVVSGKDVRIYNEDKLVFKTSYTNFKNMMSYADNEYNFFFIPITIQFYNC